MTWFKRKESINPESFNLALAQVPQLEGPGFVLRATSAPAGFKFRSLAIVAEFKVTLGDGWFLAEDLRTFFDGKISVAESWAGSQSDLFLCRQADIPRDSIAATAVLAQPELPTDSAVLLRQIEEKLEIVLYLDIAQLERINSWVQALPKL
ncbi:hypothetical protein [Arthrobacter sp. MYb213]|uniref:hypothetical protein n=1 Tax=Arthrobacter sp. MYb213 TaxID=1848595 RepID=UPI000CFCABC1|nr:hypothetical protein [Arthrobacter sp. MYb213]PRB69202.1 hypothetical protein CQ011_10425 [Arthrobacter sp. MYb213]